MPRYLALAVIIMAVGRAASADPSAEYVKRVKPLLAEKCLACHGGLKQKGKLRLDTAALARKGGKHGVAVVAGDPENSLLIERVTAGEANRMPPDGPALKPDQIDLLRRWIRTGAAGPADEPPEKDPHDHWAYRAVTRPPVPPVKTDGWARNPIDAFVARQHAAHGLTPQVEAPRGILVRRLYLDLVGMPPTPEEFVRLETDTGGQWYERLVDRLLADPRYGERWGRHWMDVWRYSDWWGLGAELRNSQRHIWHWRDWIIESLNADVGYDDMVRQMLAADELYPDDLSKLRATGFLARNFFLYNRDQWMDETVEHVSKAFLGLTMNCVKCHDHKFDPFQQVEYYRLRAFFEPYHVRTDVVPGEPDLSRDGIPCVFDGRPDAPTYLYVRGQEKNPDTSAVITPGVPAFLSFRDVDVRPVDLPVEFWQPERRSWVLDAYLTAARGRLAAARTVVDTTKRDRGQTPDDGGIAVAESALAVAEAELTSVITRVKATRAAWAGNDIRPTAEEAVRSERRLAVAKRRHHVAEVRHRLGHAKGDQKPAAEKELAAALEALTKAERAVTLPVAAGERFTPLDGARWSATRFMGTTANDPAVPFQPRSTGRRKALATWVTDPRNPLAARVAVNHLWARHLGTGIVATVFDFGRRGAAPTNPELLDWLAGDLVDHNWSMKHLHRLIVTSATYRLSSSTTGRAAEEARDPDNVFWWRRSAIRVESQVVRDSVYHLAGRLDPARGGPPVPARSDSNRRSIYFVHSNNERNVFLTTFDDALVKECYRREQSIVPQQALALTNSAPILDASQLVAGRLSADDPGDERFVSRAFAFVLGAPPTEPELRASVAALADWRRLPDGAASARANLVWVLFNHNDFVTLR